MPLNGLIHPFTPGEKNMELLTEKETSEFLKVKSATLRTWRTRGQGPVFIKIGRSVRYRMQDLEAWITERTFSNTHEAA